jgi:L-ascorbate 6-phosphate lactonase
MIAFTESLDRCAPSPGQIGLFWLGQNGFVIKSSAGRTLAVDPYLSDLAERLDGNRRLTGPVVEAGDLRVDVLAATHVHTDHLDLDSMPELLRQGVTLVCCQQSSAACQAAGLPMDQVEAVAPGDIREIAGFRIEAVFADHGDMAPAAVGFVVTVDGIALYFAGDGGYQPDRMRAATDQDLDILISPINGEYGNMNARDVAMLAAQAQPRLVVPSHFWTFARHRGNPYDFELAMDHDAPGIPYRTMRQGEGLLYSRADGVRTL